MLLAEVLSEARALPRPEQLRLIQELAAGLQRSEPDAAIVPGRTYTVWSPYAAHAAAATLLRSLGPAGTEA